uniref:Reverse transcriptase domain-containing protein n=1 Tax=Leptobrachium leishanense TaxID=445787 RepID=A0A8C5WE51_9ANUR
MYSQTPLKLLSYNVHGLNTPEKRSKLMEELHILRASVAFLQETHFREGGAPSLGGARFPIGYFSNYSSGKARGVAILFSKHVPFVLETLQTDPEGRYLFVKGTIADTKYTFASIYLPNKAQHKALATILRHLSTFTSGCLVLAGDFNVPLDPHLDTSKGSTSIPSSAIRHVHRSLSKMQLVDSWRAHSGSAREYTHYSHASSSYSRLDYIFLQQHCFDISSKAWIGTRTWSDHAPVMLEITSPLFRPKERQWRLNVSLLTDQMFCQDTDTVLQNYFMENMSTEVPIPTIWEAHKAVIRGTFISKASANKKLRSHELSTLLTDIRSLELEHSHTPTDLISQQLATLRHQLELLLNDKIRMLATKTKCFFALRENQPGKLLARILRKRRETNYISKICPSRSPPTTNPLHIQKAFRDYFNSLYNLPPPQDMITYNSNLSSYLTANTKIRLTSTEASALGAPITLVELNAALKSTKPGRSPGPDGLPIEYYKQFRSSLLPHLLSTLSSLSEGASFHPNTTAATITVIPKPNKDHTQCSNYRPISLLNSDIKLLARVLADRLSLLMPRLVHADQVGFIPGRQARDATTRVFSAIRLAQVCQTPMLLLSMDADKAFDRVSWRFLFSTLEHLGVGDGFLKWVTALYDTPTARVRVNGALRFI